MTFYVIRHVKTGQVMPQMKRGRGYTHWNPTTDAKVFAATTVPRLFPSERAARKAFDAWINWPNLEHTIVDRWEGGDTDHRDHKDDGRTPFDLEVIPVCLVGVT